MSGPTILIFIFLLFLSAFFSGTEIALMSLARHKVESFLKQGLPGSKDLEYIKKNPDRLLITILIGNNLVNTFTAAFATTIAMGIAQNSGLGLSQSTAIAIATGVVTLLLLLFGEIAPKSFAIKNAEKISLFVAKIYKILMFLLFPLVIIIEFITKVFTGKSNENKVSEEEIQAFIDMGRQEGVLEKDEHKHLENILEFNDTHTEEIMTPRVNMDKLSCDITVKEAVNYILTHTHSRIPVYEEDIDHIIGIVNTRILLEELYKGNSDKKLKDINLIKHIKVPLNKPIDELLKTFQKAHQQMAIVLDEYGGVAGLVTLEDIIEEVFGEIQDETDKEELSIKKVSENRYIVKSDVLLEEILETIGLEMGDLGIEDDRVFEGETLSYYITAILERFPNKNEEIKFDLGENKQVIFKILEVSDGVIGKIDISLKK